MLIGVHTTSEKKKRAWPQVNMGVSLPQLLHRITFTLGILHLKTTIPSLGQFTFDYFFSHNKYKVYKRCYFSAYRLCYGFVAALQTELELQSCKLAYWITFNWWPFKHTDHAMTLGLEATSKQSKRSMEQTTAQCNPWSYVDTSTYWTSLPSFLKLPITFSTQQLTIKSLMVNWRVIKIHSCYRTSAKSRPRKYRL